MGGITRLFAASDEELAQIAPGWVRALPLLDEPKTIVVPNLFGGPHIVMVTRMADAPNAAADAATCLALDSVDYVETCCVTELELGVLGGTLFEWDENEARDEASVGAIVGPDESTDLLTRVNEHVTGAVVDLSESEVRPLADDWAYELEGKISLCPSIGELETSLRTVRKLQREPPSAGIYVWNSP